MIPDLSYTWNPLDLQHPEVLKLWPWLAALATLHLALLLQQWWWQRRQFKSLALRRFGPGISLWRGLLKTALWAAAGWQLMIALAVPLGPPIKVESKQYGADVILCVDVSSSMLAQDIQPNRLTAVKHALSGMLDLFSGDRVGLVAFAGSAVVACPLTTDYGTTELFLDKLDVDSVPKDGTDLASALELALDGFGQDVDRGKLIVLATDGEDNSDSDVGIQTQILRAKQAGVAIECVGVGSPDGALIPGQRDVFGRVYAKMWKGQPVRTKLDRAGLERIASRTGGQYLPGDSSASLQAVAAKVKALKQGLGAAPDRYVREPLFQTPLLWALGLLLLESLLSLRSRGWLRVGSGILKWFSRRWRPARGAPLLLVLLLLGSAAHAALDDGRSDYNEGNDAYRRGDYGTAADNYRKAASAASTQEAADYNLGNALFQNKDYQGAINAYDEALKINPDDQDAQYNKDLAQQMLDKQNKGQDKNKKPDDKKKDDKNKNNQNQQGGGGGGGQQNGGQQNPQNPGQQKGPQGGQGQNGPQNGPQQGGQGQPNQQGGRQRRPSGGQQLSRDQIESMMNQLKKEQGKYAGAFNPMKHYGRKDKDQPENPMQQFLEDMGGLKRPKSKQPEETPKDPDYKDW